MGMSGGRWLWRQTRGLVSDLLVGLAIRVRPRETLADLRVRVALADAIAAGVAADDAAKRRA